jgi:hypothetical protein
MTRVPTRPWQHLPRYARGAARTAAALLLAVFPASASPAAAQQELSRDFQKTISLDAGQTVRIENKFGEVRVHGESGRDVKISAKIHVQGDDKDRAQSLLDKIQINVEQSGQGLRIATVYPDNHLVRVEIFGLRIGGKPSYSVDYDVAIPSDAPLSIKNSFGSVNTTGTHGSSDLDNSHGSLTVRDSGPVRLNNSFGSIDLEGAAGDTFINDSNGSVQASSVKGALDLRNRFGSISVRDIQGAATIAGGNGAVTLSDVGSATVTTSFGSAEVRNVRGDLTLHDNNGNVEISSVGGAAEISNSFGNITFSDVKGRVNCTTNNGRVKAFSVAGNTVTIRDSFGNIELENIAGVLDAETSNGKITVRDARGSVTLKTSFGGIEASNIPKGIHAVTGNGGIVINDIGADAFAKTSFGSVQAERVSGNLTVENNNGLVVAKNVKGDARVNTSFAGVTLESIGGKIAVDNQNGAISVIADRPASGCRDISLKTSFSSMRVRVPDGVGYNVTARTSFGRISSDVPITSTGTIGGDSLNGTIGSGGCSLQLTDSNGSIEIAKS